MKDIILLCQIRLLLLLLVAGLVVSGLTAFPIHTELNIAKDILARLDRDTELVQWITKVHEGVNYMNDRYPFIAYGTDWLAFAHLILAVLFAGIIKDPVKNVWVLQFGLIACAGIFPLAFIAGNARGIPFFWQLIDCSFGLIGGAILWLCYKRVRKLADNSTHIQSLNPDICIVK